MNISTNIYELLYALLVWKQHPENLTILKNIINLASGTMNANGRVLVCGNGGSYCDAMHFAEECTGRMYHDRLAMPVINLGDGGHLTCVSNDIGFEEVFSRAVYATGRPGDMLLVLSTSGKSENVRRAALTARQQRINVVAMLGDVDEETLEGWKQIATYVLTVPHKNPARIQEIHKLLLHSIAEELEERWIQWKKENP
jgi:D-sedoheptulose 7-phosphate isomerase